MVSNVNGYDGRCVAVLAHFLTLYVSALAHQGGLTKETEALTVTRTLVSMASILKRLCAYFQ